MLEALVTLALLANSAATGLLVRHAMLEKKARRDRRARLTPYGL